MAATLLRPIADSALSDDGGAAASLLQDEDDDGFLAADQQEQQDKEPRPPPPTPLQTFELAGVIFAAHVSPLPLLAPYTCASLSGPAYFLPLLLLAGTMSWLSSALVTSLQARYVGANSHAELIAAVLPHRLSKVGQTLASLFVLGGSLARTTLGIVASAEIAVDLVRPRVPRDQGGLSDDARWDRSVAVGLIGAVWLLFPFLWDPILAVLGFRRPPSTGPKTTIPYTRLGTRSQADLDLDLDLDSPSVSSPVTPPPPFEREHAEWDWNESHYRPEGGGGGGGGEPPSGRPRPPPRWSALLNLPAWGGGRPPRAGAAPPRLGCAPPPRHPPLYRQRFAPFRAGVVVVVVVLVELVLVRGRGLGGDDDRMVEGDPVDVHDDDGRESRDVPLPHCAQAAAPDVDLFFFF